MCAGWLPVVVGHGEGGGGRGDGEFQPDDLHRRAGPGRGRPQAGTLACSARKALNPATVRHDGSLHSYLTTCRRAGAAALRRTSAQRDALQTERRIKEAGCVFVLRSGGTGWGGRCAGETRPRAYLAGASNVVDGREGLGVVHRRCAPARVSVRTTVRW